MATLECLLIAHLLGPGMTPSGSGCMSLYKAAVCNRCLQSEWKQPTCFCILADPKGGTDAVCCVGQRMSHTAFELI